MTDSLLDGADNNTPLIDDSKDYFSELVGEGKKYKDERALAYKAVHADHHIATLEREKAELLEDYRKAREELNARAALEELIDQMKTKDTTGDNTQMPVVDNKPSFDPDQIESLISD